MLSAFLVLRDSRNDVYYSVVTDVRKVDCIYCKQVLDSSYQKERSISYTFNVGVKSDSIAEAQGIHSNE